MQQVITKGQIMNNANYYFCEQKEGQEKKPLYSLTILRLNWPKEQNGDIFCFIKEILTEEITPLF
jgi:hypothetical protein